MTTTLAPDDTRHGTLNAYTNLGCRCPACSSANTNYHRARNGARKREYIRKDGTCLTCRQPRKPERSRKYAKAEAYKDPFCSTECCREFHGVQLVSYAPPRPKGVSKWDDGRQRRGRLRIQRELREGHKPSDANYRNGCRCDDCKRIYSDIRKAKRAAKREAQAA